MERNDDGTASIDCKMEEANNLESANVEEDCLEEKKEIFVNESRLLPPSSSSSSSSSANTTDCKTTSNRIVVSNAQISNNSVTVSVIYPENNNAYLPTSTVEGTLEVHSKCGGTMSARRTGIQHPLFAPMIFQTKERTCSLEFFYHLKNIFLRFILLNIFLFIVFNVRLLHYEGLWTGQFLSQRYKKMYRNVDLGLFIRVYKRFKFSLGERNVI